MFFINSNDNAKIATYELNPNGERTIILIHGWLYHIRCLNIKYTLY